MSTDENSNRGRMEILKGQPSGYFVLLRQSDEDENSIGWSKYLSRLLDAWKLLAAGVIVGATLAAAIVFQMHDIYRATVLVTPASQSNAGVGSGLRNQFGGLASLVGVDLGGDGHGEESFATLSSNGFVRQFITTQDLLPQLFENRWDAQTMHWKPGRKPPTLADGVDLFNKDVRLLSIDRKTNLITLSIEWHSPQLAAQWANAMIELVNERLRAQAISDSQRSVDYLNRELEKTRVVELQQAISKVIESQVSTAMMANVHRDYAFKVIDAAVPPEKKVSPHRPQLILLGALLGMLAAAAFVIISSVLRNQKVESR